MLRLSAFLLCVLVLSGCGERETVEPLAPTPRELLFDASLPENLRISPNGRWVTFTQNYRGAPNIWLKPVDGDLPPRPITTYSYPGVGGHMWHASGEYVLFLRGTPDSDDFRPFALHLRDLKTVALAGEVAQQARFLSGSRAIPDSVYLLTNARQRGMNDIYRVDLKTGASLLVYEDELGAAGYFAGPDLSPLIAQVPQDDGGFEWRILTEDGGWRLWADVPPEEALTSRIENVSADGDLIYVATAMGRDTIAYLAAPSDERFDPKTADVLAAQDAFDFVDATYALKTQKPFVAEFATPRPSWVPVDRAFAPTLLAMRASGAGQLDVADAAGDAPRWLIGHKSAATPPSWGVFDAELGEKISLFPEIDALFAAQAALQPKALEIPLADGGAMTAYLTLPAGTQLGPDGLSGASVPAVLIVRNALFSSETWAYRPLHQWFASRGVAALSINHRGSAGQGKAHMQVPEGTLSRTIAADMARAKAWLAEQKIVKDDAFGVFAMGIGGHAALSWVSSDDSASSCIALASPVLNMRDLLETLPEEFSGLQVLLENQTGAIDLTPSLAGNSAKKIFVAHGMRNRRQPSDIVEIWAQSELSNGHDVTLALFDKAAERFDHGSDARALFALAEPFFGDCLGMTVETPTLEDFQRASVTIPIRSKATDGAVLAQSR